MPVTELDRSDFIPCGKRRGYAVKVYAWTREGREGKFVAVEQYESVRDDYSGEEIWRRKSQVTVTDASVARRIARELEDFASLLEEEGRKMNESGSGTLPNERKEPKFRGVLFTDDEFAGEVHNRPPSESSTGEEGTD